MASLNISIVFIIFIFCGIVSALCPTKAAFRTPGDHPITLPSGRTAILHVPANYNQFSTPAPLVLSLHQNHKDAAFQENLTGFSPKSDANRFFVVYPQGLYNSWNAGACCGDAQSNHVDDIAFFKDLLDYLTSNMCINKDKIYSTGMSNGAFMSYRLACNETGYMLAAIGPVAGLNASIPPDTYPCAISRPVPIVHFYGTQDPLITEAQFNATIQGWAAKDMCNYNKQTARFSNNTAYCYDLACPRPVYNNITVCRIFNGIHAWPGGNYAGSSGDIKATDVIWDFFSRFSL